MSELEKMKSLEYESERLADALRKAFEPFHLVSDEFEQVVEYTERLQCLIKGRRKKLELKGGV